MRWHKSVKNEVGFTLVEVAIVLIIIGLILGAAIKGKDLIQSAKQKKFYSNFVKQWEVTVLDYYDRTGGVIGDGNTNGGTTATTDGRFDNINNATKWGAVGNPGTGVLGRLQAVGLDLPTTNTGTSYTYSFKGSTSGSRTVTLALDSLNATTGGGGSSGTNMANNVLYFTLMPTDLAIALDNVIDGSANGKNGKFRHYPDTTDWPNVNTTTTVNAMYILDVP
ncbi:MAG: prepilin-type N-terminal cleavage/methylation domain-containing protein [Deltaproteobacteria bacterium]|nr:prepilin-type N-terminal cleavage/methylation domain-containing protein [Deltaproteobacteria bacterium]